MVKSINEPDTPTIKATEPQSINEPETAALLTLALLEPTEAVCGDADDVELHVHGSGFTAESVITFNGGDEPTTYVSETELTTIVKPSTATTPGAYPVTVRNGTGPESEALNFEFLAAPLPERRAL